MAQCFPAAMGNGWRAPLESVDLGGSRGPGCRWVWLGKCHRPGHNSLCLSWHGSRLLSVKRPRVCLSRGAPAEHFQVLLLLSAKYKPQWEASLSLVLCFLPLPLRFLNLAAGPAVSKSKMKIPL